MVDENQNSLANKIGGVLVDPFAKLAKVVTHATGMEGYIARKDGDVIALKMREVAKAAAEIGEQSGVAVQYEDGPIKIGLAERARVRVGHQEVQRQQNVESVIGHAAARLDGAAPVSEEPPDPQWTSRFFSCAQDVSSDDLQKQWGKILAGEVAWPGSFSLRTLDVVRNTSKQEAEIFSVMARGAIQVGEDAFFVSVKQGNVWQGGFGSEVMTVENVESDRRFPYFTSLVEMGVAIDKEMSIYCHPQNQNIPGLDSCTIKCGNKILLIQNFRDGQMVTLRVWKLTRAGREMLRLIPDEDPGMRFIEHLAAPFKENGCHVSVGDAVPVGDGGWYFNGEGKPI